MTDLNMDESHRVNAAAHGFTGAVTSYTGKAKAVVQELAPIHRAQSELDNGLEKVRHWIGKTIIDAIPRAQRRAQATSEHTEHTTGAFDAEDTAGAQQVHRTSV
ncbi:hypothetical protein [Nocardia sp. NPDC057440]|uniref:hypothetical protein n=1 Tax=Nocardia sp. NPDC057440 TaxID=3346134 RepID=UPI00366DAE47